MYTVPPLRVKLIKQKGGDGRWHIPSVLFISCTLAVMHAVGCWLGLADHSSTKRTNRCSIASPNRGDLTRSNLAGRLGICRWSRRRRRRGGRSEGYAESKKIRPGGERGREGLEDKERQTERGGRWETSCSPEGSLLVSHSTGPSNV